MERAGGGTLGSVRHPRAGPYLTIALPAKAGIQGVSPDERSLWLWFPAFAGKAAGD
jgi:hypothetical protein